VYNLLPSFFNDAYFNQGTIKIYNRATSYNKGHIVNSEVLYETLTCRKIIIPVSARELTDKGLGQYNTNVTFQLYVSKPLKFSSGSKLQVGDIVEYNSEKYKLISELNFNTHGFYNYFITKFEDTRVND